MTTNAPDGRDIAVYAYHDGHGDYIDLRAGQELGRDHRPNISLDPPALHPAIDTELARQSGGRPERGAETRTYEPGLCPAGLDKTHGDLIDGDMKPGDFADAKGEEYEKLFAKPFADDVIAKLRKQGERQVRAAAARGARVKWYFAQKGAADFIREDFENKQFLKEITISHMPSRKGR